MTVEQAVSIFKKKYPNLYFQKIGDYDEEHYVIEATKSNEASDEVDPYYGIDKRTGEITNFIPGEDLERFIEVMGYGADEKTESISHSVMTGIDYISSLL